MVTRMFENFFASIPSNRLEMVNDLEIPEVTLDPYVWTELDDLPSTDSLTDSEEDLGSLHTLSTESSIPLSRAMTDSEIDYERYRRFKGRSFSHPWELMQSALDAFPPGYLASVNSFMSEDTLSDLNLDSYEKLPRYNEDLRLKMERFFEDECEVFSPDDHGLLDLEDALQSIDLKALEMDLNSSVY